jgi:2-dehydropantoate 2-reductase
MKIAVVGAGAMGSLFGGRLKLAGNDVSLIDVNAAHVAAVRQHGLLLELGDACHTVALSIGEAKEFSELVDLLLVFTKAVHTSAALEAAKHLIGPETRVLTLQNGLGNADRLVQVAPADRVLFGFTNWPADFVGPGHVRSHGLGKVSLWSYDDRLSAFAQTVCGVLSDAGLACSMDPQVIVAIWEKVAFNAAMNSIAAVTGSTVGQMADDSDLRELVATVVKETAEVAKARGVPVSERRITEMVALAFADHREHKPSMLQDVLHRRATEIGAINGAILDEAKRAGRSAPVTQTLLRLVRAKERRYACT